jgi:hypothetical protein
MFTANALLALRKILCNLSNSKMPVTTMFHQLGESGARMPQKLNRRDRPRQTGVSALDVGLTIKRHTFGLRRKICLTPKVALRAANIGRTQRRRPSISSFIKRLTPRSDR